MTHELVREVASLRDVIEQLVVKVDALERRMPDTPDWETADRIPQWFPERRGLSRRSLDRMAVRGEIRRRRRGNRTEFYVPDLQQVLEGSGF